MDATLRLAQQLQQEIAETVARLVQHHSWPPSELRALTLRELRFWGALTPE